MNTKRFLSVGLLLLVTGIALWQIRAVADGVRAGLSVAVRAVIPPLFLFMVQSDLLCTALLCGKPLLPAKWTVFLLGSVCGFPVGARICERYRESGRLSEKDAAALLPFCNNVSPAFALGTVGAALFGDIRIGVCLYAAALLSAFLLLLPLRIRERPISAAYTGFDLSAALNGAVEHAVSGALRVGAWICLFSALLAVLRTWVPDAVFPFLAVLTEIGSGCAACAALYASAPRTALLLAAFGCGFSGICVQFQILSSVKSIKVKPSPLLLGKLAQGLLAALLILPFCIFAL